MKKLTITVLTAFFTISLCFSQDLMTKKSGEDIKANVVEVTTTEIKYKKFDNLSGPIYSILKSDVLMIRYKNGTKDIFIEEKKIEPVSTPTPITTSDALKANIYFIRSTSFNGSLAAFIDKQLVCRLNDKKYSIHKLDAGEHSFSVQFPGQLANEKAEPITINIEAGKTYYIQMVFQSGFWANNIYCKEVTEISAKTVLSGLSLEKECM